MVSFLNDIFWLLGQVWQKKKKKKCLQEAEMTLSLLKTQRKLNWSQLFIITASFHQQSKC